MNEAEKALCEALDEPMCPCGERTAPVEMEQAAALIREQDAKIKRMSEALRNIWSNDYISYRHNLKINHAEALRDAGVEP
jgi:hypothetical protein